MDRDDKPKKKTRRRKRFVKRADHGPTPDKARKNSPSNKPSSTAWVDNAQWYDQLVGDEGSEYHRHVVLPGVLRLLSVGERSHSLQGKRILDLCCGQGVLCRLLSKHGASVAGVDASAPLIRLAQQRGPEHIHYHLADAAQLFRKASKRAELTLNQTQQEQPRPKALLPGSFDHVLCILALQDLANLRDTFASAALALRAGGTFIAVIMHPCFRTPKHSHWGWDDDASVQFRRIDRYLTPFDAPIQTHPGSKPDAKTTTHHRPLQDYINALSPHGLLIDAMQEWPSHKNSDSGPRAKAENVARKEFPMFLALRAVKVVSAA